MQLRPLRTAEAVLSTPDSDTGLRILVIEDHQNSAEVMSMYLGMNGHRVETAQTAESGFELARKRDFDLVISDLVLPDQSGVDFLRRLRKIRTTPAIAITGYGRADDIARAADAGFAAHFVKPVDLEALCTEITRIVARCRTAG